MGDAGVGVQFNIGTSVVQGNVPSTTQSKRNWLNDTGNSAGGSVTGMTRTPDSFRKRYSI